MRATIRGGTRDFVDSGEKLKHTASSRAFVEALKESRERKNLKGFLGIKRWFSWLKKK